MNQPLQEQGKGFLRALFDFSFTSYITPKIIKVIFGIVIVVAALGWLGYSIFFFSVNVVLGIVVLIIVGPLIFLLTVIIYRVYLEVVMAVFTIAENTTRMARGTGGIQGGPVGYQGGTQPGYPGSPPPAYAGDASGGYQPPPSWAPTQTADPSRAWTPPSSAAPPPPWSPNPQADAPAAPPEWPGTPSGPPPPQPPPG